MKLTRRPKYSEATFCCSMMQTAAEQGFVQMVRKEQPTFVILHDRRDMTISHCPFCGEKIEIEIEEDMYVPVVPAHRVK